MIIRRRQRPQPASRRNGLAPLELVLSAPVMMLLLALMIITGTAGSWKLRTQANSRQAAYRAIWPRTGEGDPDPDNWWPGSATMNFQELNSSPLPGDPFAQHIVVRGPSIGPLIVIDETLDMTDGLHEGYAEIDRELPIFRRLDYRNSFQHSHQIFADEQWEHAQMQINNVQRRIPTTYEYDLARSDPSLTAQMMQSVNALMSNPDRPALFILDRDDEIRPYWGDLYVPYTNDQYDQYSAYPAAARSCNLERCACVDTDLRMHVDNLLDEIENVPDRLSNIFIRRYQDELNRLPPPSDQRQAELQEKIDQLNQFKRSLP